MKNLFIIDGTSGIWKSDLIQYVSSYLHDADLVRKYSTRPKRNYERSGRYLTDLEFVNEHIFESLNLEYQYVYNGYMYGFSQQALNAALEDSSRVFIMIRNLEIIKELTLKLTDVNIVTVFIYTDFAEVSKRLPIKTNESLRESIAHAFDDYLRHPEMYQEVLINGSSANDFYRLIDLLVRKYEQPQGSIISNRRDLQDSNILELPPDFYRAIETLTLVRTVIDSNAKRSANFILIVIAGLCLLIWMTYMYAVESYDWNLIEPRLSIISLPILGYAMFVLAYVITKKDITLNPSVIHQSLVEYFRLKNYRRYNLDIEMIASLENKIRRVEHQAL